jgi:hypothetical protein
MVSFTTIIERRKSIRWSSLGGLCNIRIGARRLYKFIQHGCTARLEYVSLLQLVSWFTFYIKWSANLSTVKSALHYCVCVSCSVLLGEGSKMCTCIRQCYSRREEQIVSMRNWRKYLIIISRLGSMVFWSHYWSHWNCLYVIGGSRLWLDFRR